MRDHRNGGTRPQQNEAVGVLLLLASAAAFSAAGFFTRMAPVDPVAMVFWRNTFGGLGLVAVLLGRRSGLVAPLCRLGRAGWAAVALSAASMVCYLTAFAYTSVANVAIIYATAPVMTAILARIVLGERLAPRTAMAACLALAGVAITVAGSPAAGSTLGDGLALLMTIGLSAVAVLTRGRALPPLSTALASAAVAALAILPVAASAGTGLQIGLRDAAWLAAFGIVTITVAWPMSLAGTARVPAARAMLLSAFELPLAPLWVWLAAGEVPSRAAMTGGAVALAAVLWDVTASPARPSRPDPISQTESA